MPTFSGTYATETYFTCVADDADSARDIIQEMGEDEYDNANLMLVKDIEEVK